MEKFWKEKYTQSHEQWWNIIWNTSKKIKTKLFATLIWLWILAGGWIIAKKSFDKVEKENSYSEYFWSDDKVFIIDVSENNQYDESKFKEWNTEKWNRKSEDVRGVSWVYVRIQSEKWEDASCKKFYEWIKEYNKNCEHWQHIAIWCYIYFNKQEAATTDEWIEKEVDLAVRNFNILNNKKDSVVDLVPMLDFEYSTAEGKDPWVNSEKWQRCKDAALKRLQLFEEKTWIVPWIYTWASLYNDYFFDDERFSKYPVWISAYNETRVNQSADVHSVNVWSLKDPKAIQPDIIQFIDNIKWSWFWTSGSWNLDWNTTTQGKFKELIIKNDDAPKDLK